MALIVALPIALAVTPVAALLARRLGIVDHPGPLKVHARAVPYLGGVAVYLALVAPLAVERPLLLVPLGLALMLGVADDIADLSFRIRLALEVVIGLTAAWVVPSRGPLGALLTVVLVIVLLNAVNLLDGLDGLACGVAAVSALGFAVVLDDAFRVFALALAGALAGLLVWNRPPAAIYLGDGGSYLIGTALALLLASAFGNGEPVAVAGASLLLVAVPVADTVIALVRRRRAKRPLFRGDRGHVYDQIVERGRSPLVAVAACVGAQALLAGAGVGVAALPGAAAVAVTATVVVGVGGVALRVFTNPATWAHIPRGKVSSSPKPATNGEPVPRRRAEGTWTGETQPNGDAQQKRRSPATGP